MPAQLVTAKLHFPILRRGLVSRPQLVALLDRGLKGPFTLVSAPAGYGKSTLLAEWRSGPGHGLPAAWLSLEPGDDNPARFWLYLAAAIDLVEPGSCQGTLALVRSPQLPSQAAILDSLFEEIGSYPQDLVCVLDDWHVIGDPGLQQGLAYLIGHLPANLHLAVLTRSDPPLPLSRMRVTQQMVEIRAGELRFSLEETASFLTRVMGLSLSAEEIDALEKRSEGWAAGLQLAALSMQGRSPDQVEAFIAAFAGSHRFIVDYLLEEVLNQQPAEIREFLLKTSILERMCADLCDALLVTPHSPAPPAPGAVVRSGASDREPRIVNSKESPFTIHYSQITGSDLPSSQEIFAYLDRSNLFLIPLDDERRWNRYHHLFRDLLQTSLAKAYPGQVEELHCRASAWYAEQNMPEQAIRHALAGRDYDRAAVLVEQASQQLDMETNLVAITRWIDATPDEVVAAHPWLSIYRAWGYQWMGKRDAVETWLNAAEAALAAAGPGQRTETDRRHLLGHMSAIRAHSALIGENITRVLEEGRKALELLPERDEMYCETAVAMGGAYWALGQVVESERAFAAARAAALKCSFPTMAVPSTCYVGMQQAKQGRLATALRTYADALRLATSPDGRETSVAGFPNIKLGDIYREQNDLERASQHLRRGIEQCALLGQADVLMDGYVCMARFELATGSIGAARDYLGQADALVARTQVDPFVRCWLEDSRLRLWILEGDTTAVARWIETCGLAVDGPLSYHYDLHHANLARAMIALGMWDHSPAPLNSAVGLLGRLFEAADRAGWVHEKIHILILRALAENGLGQEDKALGALAQALVLAEPGGYVRSFLEEGEECLQLLRKAGALVKRGNIGALDLSLEAKEMPDRLAWYIDGLVRAGGEEKDAPGPAPRQPAEGSAPGPAAVAGEVLTAREIEVLRLIEAGCSNQEIALKLVIALGTVKRHTVNIFNKLDVTSRTQAVAKARLLGLI